MSIPAAIVLTLVFWTLGYLILRPIVNMKRKEIFVSHKITQEEMNKRENCEICGAPVYVHDEFAGYKPYKSKYCVNHTYQKLKIFLDDDGMSDSKGIIKQ